MSNPWELTAEEIKKLWVQADNGADYLADYGVAKAAQRKLVEHLQTKGHAAQFGNKGRNSWAWGIPRSIWQELLAAFQPAIEHITPDSHFKVRE